MLFHHRLSQTLHEQLYFIISSYQSIQSINQIRKTMIIFPKGQEHMTVISGAMATWKQIRAQKITFSFSRIIYYATSYDEMKEKNA